ncbi:MAG: protein translocase subunit SecF [Chromatiales bacterium]|nr:protein translocase subunit SecF [Chromatiales bacterium]
MELIKETHINFMGLRKGAFILSVLLIVLSIGSIATRGLNFGIDFTGGVLLEVGYPQAADLPALRDQLTNAGIEGAQVQNFGTSRDVMIRIMPDAIPGDDIEKDHDVGEHIMEILTQAEPGVELRRVEFVGPQVGEELTEQGSLAMLFALIMIGGYVWARFQWKLSAGALAALTHDVTITLGFFAVTQIAFDLSVLAAVLAVIGYSLNDTIVVYDRIRENFRGMRNGDPELIMNVSLNQMLGRTLVTSGTTLLVLFALFFLGGEAIRPFSVALLIGIFIGTYSSIYVASALALELKLTLADLMPPKKEDLVDDMP